ncbi:MAG: S-methyl-5-thioribose-1-phosphate isomerase [Bdellovibrionia bacterium]
MQNINSFALRYNLQNQLFVLDQQLLPQEEKWLEIKTVKDMIEAIKSLAVRGAPMIGVAASFALAQSAQNKTSLDQLLTEAEQLYQARPTAVNLMNCIERMRSALREKDFAQAALAMAYELYHEDVTLCDRIAHNGGELIQDGDGILTHCNTGALATAGVGTALGIIHKAHLSGKKIHVFVDETRPLLQGGRLTAWELGKLGIPYTLITDNMAGLLMAQGKIQKVFVGSDRIAINGDFANKIGTYSVAVLAHYHRIPFYVAAPYTTVDFACPNGQSIPIEERNAQEVTGAAGSFGKVTWAPENASVYNPAFDVTPAALTSAWITDAGVFYHKDILAGCFTKKGV